LGIALDHLSSRWGKPDLQVYMIPLSFGEDVKKEEKLKSWEGPLVDISANR
jgi:hypothetical protein